MSSSAQRPALHRQTLSQALCLPQSAFSRSNTRDQLLQGPVESNPLHSHTSSNSICLLDTHQLLGPALVASPSRRHRPVACTADLSPVTGLSSIPHHSVVGQLWPPSESNQHLSGLVSRHMAGHSPNLPKPVNLCRSSSVGECLSPSMVPLPAAVMKTPISRDPRHQHSIGGGVSPEQGHDSNQVSL